MHTLSGFLNIAFQTRTWKCIQIAILDSEDLHPAQTANIPYKNMCNIGPRSENLGNYCFQISSFLKDKLSYSNSILQLKLFLSQLQKFPFPVQWAGLMFGLDCGHQNSWLAIPLLLALQASSLAGRCVDRSISACFFEGLFFPSNLCVFPWLS